MKWDRLSRNSCVTVVYAYEDGSNNERGDGRSPRSPATES